MLLAESLDLSLQYGEIVVLEKDLIPQTFVHSGSTIAPRAEYRSDTRMQSPQFPEEFLYLKGGDPLVHDDNIDVFLQDKANCLFTSHYAENAMSLLLQYFTIKPTDGEATFYRQDICHGAVPLVLVLTAKNGHSCAAFKIEVRRCPRVVPRARSRWVAGYVNDTHASQ